ncbi:hypothetical protein ABEW05_005988 [Botrytis cinerea]
MCDPLYDSDSDPGSDFGPRCLAPGLGSRQQLIPSLLERLTRACTALRERIVNDATTWKRVMAGGKSMLIKNWAGTQELQHPTLHLPEIMAILQVGAGAKATVTLSHDRRLHLRIKDFSKGVTLFEVVDHRIE